MTDLPRGAALASLFTALLALLPSVALAGGAVCLPGDMTTRVGNLPANTTVLAFQTESGTVDEEALPEDTLTLTVTDGDGTRELEYTVENDGERGHAYFIRPAESLEAGQELRLTGHLLYGNLDARCELPFDEVWQVVDDAPAPSVLGTLSATYTERDVIVDSVLDGFPVRGAASTVLVSLELDIETEAWSNQFIYAVRIDGEPWSALDTSGFETEDDKITPRFVPGQLRIESEGALIYSACAGEATEGDAGVEPGLHQVEVIATVPDTDIQAVAEIEIDLPPCGASESDDDAANATDDPSDDAVDDDVGAADGPGGCSAAGPGAGTSSGLGCVLLVLALWRRITALTPAGR